MHLINNIHPVAHFSSPFPGPNMNQKNKVTVITRDNIRTLKPRSEATLKKMNDDSLLVSKKKKNIRIRPNFENASNPAKIDSHETLLQKSVNTTAAPASKGAYLINSNELYNVKKLSTFLSKEQMDEIRKEAKAQKIKALEEAHAKKQRLEEFDHQRMANQKLSDLETETREKANYLLTKAKLQLDEQEDEIKSINEKLLYAKCVAIRDIQVEENKMISKERKQEEARLDALMEIERIADLKRIEEREKKRIEEMRKGASQIRVQIEERKEFALFEQEKRDQETKAILKALADNAEHARQEKIAKVEAQRQLMQVVVKANMESALKKKEQKMQSLEEDRKALQYLIEKDKKEEENERQLAIRKAEREKELARLRAAQEKLSGKQAEQDALRAIRAYESYEREWRRKEKEAAEKKALQETQLREDRINQQRARDEAAALEAHKMKIEFLENLKRQHLEDQKLKGIELENQRKSKQYSYEIKKQIEERALLKKKEREDFFLEGVKLAKEAKERNLKIKEIKERKINQLRSLGLPEKYCKDVERRSNMKIPA